MRQIRYRLRSISLSLFIQLLKLIIVPEPVHTLPDTLELVILILDDFHIVFIVLLHYVLNMLIIDLEARPFKAYLLFLFIGPQKQMFDRLAL